jgi:ATP:corrinoid adenosyltransferase
VVKLLANMAHASVGHRTKYEKIMTKKEQIGLVAWDYGTGKASPIAAFGLQMAAGHDFQGRPIGMPWSEPLSMSQRMKGKIPYSAGEYLAETLSPLPVEELVKDAWRSQGMDEPTINRFWRGLVIGGGMGLTGARITPLGQ